MTSPSFNLKKTKPTCWGADVHPHHLSFSFCLSECLAWAHTPCHTERDIPTVGGCVPPCPTVPMPCPVAVCWDSLPETHGTHGRLFQWLHTDPRVTLPVWLSKIRRLNEVIERCVGYPRVQDLAQIIHLPMNML